MRLTEETTGLIYDTSKGWFTIEVDYFDLARFLRGVFPSLNRFKKEFIDFFNVGCSMNGLDHSEIFATLSLYYSRVTPYTYKEAFEISNNTFRNLVFGSVDVAEMVKELGSKRISVEGMPVKHRKYDANGEFLGWEEYDVVYELHHVDCSKIGVNESLPVVKCWCTSTNNEHYLWVDESFKNGSPLEAIASTCVVYENMLPHIKEIKRHGDIFLFEMDKEVEPRGDVVALTKDQYFGLLTAQS